MLQCGAFSLHDFLHACKEAKAKESLKLTTFPRRQYDSNGTAKDFTTMVKVKPFTHEEDAFDDLFLQKETFSEVMHMASLIFTPDDVKNFHVYRKRRLLKVPLDLFQIEPIREPTPDVSLEDSSKENSEEETQEIYS